MDRWFGVASVAERRILARAPWPVLDIGCGPGRHVAALAALGVPALGIDVSELAVRLARRRGAEVWHGSVFAALPGEGAWGAVLLLDGNIGIGGNPLALLRRADALVRPGGRVLVEVGAPGTPLVLRTVRVRRGRRDGPSFRWADVGCDDVAWLARRAGLRPHSPFEREGRWYAWLVAA